MRLHRLEVGAIGPFAGAQVIDFGPLSASGLFLLEGPTGAGKSTLLDALVFALYGEPTATGSYDRLRSDYASDQDESFVDLTYEVGGGIYRIRRTPHYERARQRGEGTTVKPSSARIWRLTSPDDPHGELVSSKVEEASAEARRTIGLSREQFLQIVVLPQGQFASFLRADSEQRRTLLQRIFGTELYQRLADELSDRRSRAEASRKQAAANLQGAVTTLVGGAGLGDRVSAKLFASVAELAGREGDPDQAGSLFEDLDAIRQDARAKAESTAEGAARAAAAAKQAQAGAGRERQRAEAAHLRTRLERRLQELEADRPRRVELDRGLDAARRADPIIDALDAADQSRRDLAQARLEAQAIGLDTSQMDSAELRDALERAVALARGGTDRLDAARALERAAAVGEQAASALADLETRSQAAQAATAEAAKAVERESQIGPPARAEVARLEELALVIGQHAEAVTALAAADARRDGAKLAYGRAQASELRLRNLRLASMAGEMAEGLDPGQPCPVCGATEHPAPAALTADHVTRDQVLRAEAKRQQAEAAYELAARQAGEAKALVSRLEGSGGAGDAAQVADQLVRARAELAALGEPRQLAGRLGRAEAALNEVRQQVDQARQAAEAAHDRVVEIQGVAGGVSVADAEAALAGANAQVADARRRIEAAQAVALAASRDEASQAAAERALAGSGFATLEQARAARLDPAEIDRRQAELTRLAGEEAGIKTRLAEPALAEAGGDPAALEESANRAAAGAEAAAVAAAEAAGVAAVAKRLDESTSAWVGSVRLAADGLAAVKRGSAALIRVADLANAGRSNLRDVDLPTYVLIRRFEEVIDAANTRLGPMSDGQYQLERSDTKEATRKRRTGLALRVMDNATGEARDPRTLSGGETFYVSLALALGLADVVTAEAGGISLETLFVDEGFGSLSEEALESVLSQLNRIRAGGRVVGVISHVEALKQAIPDRIEVRPSRHGGSVLRRA